MQFKSFFLSVAMIALCGYVSAQDKIYKRDGDVLDTKIKSVGIRTVTYQMFNNLTGPEYTIEKAAVEKIVYQNGSEDVFDDMRLRRRMHHHTTATTDAGSA